MSKQKEKNSKSEIEPEKKKRFGFSRFALVKPIEEEPDNDPFIHIPLSNRTESQSSYPSPTNASTRSPAHASSSGDIVNIGDDIGNVTKKSVQGKVNKIQNR